MTMGNLLVGTTMALAAAAGVSGAFVDQYWSMDWVPNQDPAGLGKPRAAVGFNSSWPPPPVVVNSTDTLHMTMYNNLNQGGSLHSHGIFFNNTAYYDGTTPLTQCPIPHGGNLTYEILNSARDAPNSTQNVGTYWMHSHTSGAYTDGMRTPLIIHPAEGSAHKYDDDYTILFSDWYVRYNNDLLHNEFLNPKNPTGAEPIPDACLMYAVHTPQNGPTNPPYLPGFNENVTIHFEPGKTYRLRFINVGVFSMANLWLDGHEMRIIELDGVETEEYPVDVVPLAAAQRVSVLVTARNDTSQDWRLNSYQNTDMYDTVPKTIELHRYMRIGYADQAQELGPLDMRDTFAMFDETALRPIEVKEILQPDVKTLVPFNFNTFKSNRNYAIINDTTFVAPQTPSLFTALSMGEQANDLAVYGPGTNAFMADWLQTIEITIQNLDTGEHPFHLHGFVFQVVQKTNDSSSAPAIDESQPNPMRRDTISIPAGGQVVLRVYVDAPGVWFLHCHIQWHLQSGLAAILVAAPNRIREQIKLPPEMIDHCAASGLPSTGNAGGLFSTTDFGSYPDQPPMFPVGWTGKATGAFIGCLISAIIGLGSIIIYGMTDADPDEEYVLKKKWYKTLWGKARRRQN